jgi:hypothetical protein
MRRAPTGVVAEATRRLPYAEESQRVESRGWAIPMGRAADSAPGAARSGRRAHFHAGAWRRGTQGLLWRCCDQRARQVHECSRWPSGAVRRRPIRWCLAGPPSCARGSSMACDADDEGERGAERFRELAPRARRIRPSVGNDVSEFLKASGRIRAWITFELARSPSAISTRRSPGCRSPKRRPSTSQRRSPPRSIASTMA